MGECWRNLNVVFEDKGELGGKGLDIQRTTLTNDY